MKKSILQGCKKVTIAIYDPRGYKISQISFFAVSRCEREIVAFFERMDGDYLGALYSLLCAYPFWIRGGAARRIARFYLAIRELYGRNNIARAFVGRAPVELELKQYRFLHTWGAWAVKAASPAAAFILYKEFDGLSDYVFDYLLSCETADGGVFRKTRKRDPHGIGYMRVIPAGREGRN